jgi:histone-lysine N-methyltransferase SETMAR
MELDWEQIRLLLHFQWQLKSNATDAAKKICEAYGEGIVSVRTAQEWFKKFREGNEDLSDKPRSGRSREVNRQAVVNAIEEDPSMTTRMLADDFDCDHVTILTILHEAGKNIFCFLKFQLFKARSV